MAHYYAQLIIDQQLLDISTSESKEKEKRQVAATDYQLVDIHSISHERVREIGAEWLCQQALEQLGLEPALHPTCAISARNQPYSSLFFLRTPIFG